VQPDLPGSTPLHFQASEETLASSEFTHSADILRQIARDVLDYARERGATAAETEASEGFGQSVTVRRGEVETIEYNRDKGVGVSVYIGKQRGHASTSDFSAKALRDTVDAALSIARLTASDQFAGLADADLLATQFPNKGREALPPEPSGIFRFRGTPHCPKVAK